MKKQVVKVFPTYKEANQAFRADSAMFEKMGLFFKSYLHDCRVETTEATIRYIGENRGEMARGCQFDLIILNGSITVDYIQSVLRPSIIDTNGEIDQIRRDS